MTKTLHRMIEDKLFVSYHLYNSNESYWIKENMIADLKQEFKQFIREVNTTGNDGSEEELTKDLRQKIISEIDRK